MLETLREPRLGRGCASLESVRIATCAACLADSRIRTAFLFGSQASGAATDESDVDIGIFLDPPSMPGEATRVSLEVAQRIADHLERDDVDVVPLNDAEPLLRFIATNEGVPLYQRAPGLCLTDAIRASKVYMDLQPLLEHEFRRLVQRQAPC